MPNDLPPVRLDGDTVNLSADAWNDLLSRLTVAEGRLAAHHYRTYDLACPTCEHVQAL